MLQSWVFLINNVVKKRKALKDFFKHHKIKIKCVISAHYNTLHFHGKKKNDNNNNNDILNNNIIQKYNTTNSNNNK